MDLGICKRCGYFEGRCACGKGKILLKAEDRVKVSKFLSGLLRHFAGDFGVQLDREGWARLEGVVRVVRERFNVGRAAIELIAAFDAKRRFEIRDGKIRARYGHSIPVDKDWSESDEVPEKLYHATHPRNVKSILEKGLLPMRRIEVHMCERPEEALEVGRRHCSEPVLLEIDANKAEKAGIRIRKKGRVYTADRIPPEFIKVVNWTRWRFADSR